MVRSSVVLPTPLRPSSVTDSPSRTDKLMSSNTRLLPYAADISFISSMGNLLFASQVNRNDRRVALNLLERSFLQQPPLVHYSDGGLQLRHKRHVVIDHQDAVFFRKTANQLRCLAGLIR